MALQAGGLVVNSSQGGGSKDTWVMGARAEVLRAAPPAPRPAVPFPLPSGPPMDHGPVVDAELGQQQ